MAGRKLRLPHYFDTNVDRKQRPKFIPNLHGLYDKPLPSRRLLHAFVSDYLNSFLMIGRVGERRIISLNPL